ncbi:MAG: hypothetical protein Q9174_000246 [Haloplaca sp. 1 TL-2023]
MSLRDDEAIRGHLTASLTPAPSCQSVTRPAMGRLGRADRCILLCSSAALLTPALAIP